MQVGNVVLAYVGAQVALVAQEVRLHSYESNTEESIHNLTGNAGINVKQKNKKTDTEEKSSICDALCKRKGEVATRAIGQCTEIPEQFRTHAL